MISEPPRTPVAYDVDFDRDESHGRIVTLLTARAERGLVIDLGCGYAPHAEPLRDAGFDYVGLDIDDRSLDTLHRRGFDARRLDLGDVDAVLDEFDTIVSGAAPGREIVAVLALDVVEHLVAPQLLLARIATWMADHPSAVLGLSIPNVAYRDVAAKLLGGRWDVTPTGLLDHTHLRFFTDASLNAMMRSASFSEVAALDRPAERSDQHWPVGAPHLSPTTRLGLLLAGFRGRIDDHSTTYQFVRLYAPAGDAPAGDAPAGDAPRPTIVVDVPPRSDVFLSVLADPAMTAADIAVLRTQLEGQTSDGWELIVATDPDGGLDAMLDAARGDYVSIVAPGESVVTGWVEQFARVGRTADGFPLATILRCDAVRATDREVVAVDTDDADGVAVDAGGAHADPAIGPPGLGDLTLPGACFALPSEALRTMRIRLDTQTQLTPVVSALLDTFQFCGVTDSTVVAVRATSPTHVDRTAVAERMREIDRLPVLLGAGTLGHLDDLERARRVAEARVAELDAQIATSSADNAWLNAELSPAPVRVVRRLLRRPSRR